MRELDITQVAMIEATSEDPAHPIENAFLPGAEGGWRAARPGAQTIRMRFDPPQPIRRVHLRFSERDVQRTQEFVLKWSDDEAAPYRDIVRQQWNFSPAGSTSEHETYEVALERVTSLELSIRPDIGGGDAVASIERFAVF